MSFAVDGYKPVCIWVRVNQRNASYDLFGPLNIESGVRIRILVSSVILRHEPGVSKTTVGGSNPGRVIPKT